MIIKIPGNLKENDPRHVVDTSNYIDSLDRRSSKATKSQKWKYQMHNNPLSILANFVIYFSHGKVAVHLRYTYKTWLLIKPIVFLLYNVSKAIN